MSNAQWFAVIVLAGSTTIGAAQWISPAAPPPPARSQTSSDIGLAGDWKPTQMFLDRVYALCDKGKKANYDECFMTHMANAGAPPEAARTTRLIYKALGEVAIVTDFKPAGPVDMARVQFPLRATDKAGLLLVNGDPKVLDVDDLKKLNHAQMEAARWFLAIKDKFANADVWPGDRSGAMWPVVSTSADGGIEVVIGYPILDGCQTCSHVGLALFGWDFDAQGKFVGTRYKPLPPPPKKTRPAPMPAPGPGPAPGPKPQEGPAAKGAATKLTYRVG